MLIWKVFLFKLSRKKNELTGKSYLNLPCTFTTVFSCPNFKLVTNDLIKNPSDDYFLYGPVYWDSKARLVMEQIYPKETFLS